jgi:hypothetical protein
MVRFIFVATSAAFLVGPAAAAPLAFTDRSAFEAAIASIGGVAPVVEDYEGFTGEDAVSGIAGDVIADGATANGITYTYSIFDDTYELAVRGAGGISGTNTLGATGNDGTNVELLGFDDTITFRFAASNAFGFSLLTSGPNEIFPDDFTLTFGSETLRPDGSPGVDGANGGEYFFGFVDADATHTSATLTFDDIGLSIGEIDDLTISAPVTDAAVVPLPAGVWLLLSAFGGLALLRRRARA